MVFLDSNAKKRGIAMYLNLTQLKKALRTYEQ